MKIERIYDECQKMGLDYLEEIKKIKSYNANWVKRYSLPKIPITTMGRVMVNGKLENDYYGDYHLYQVNLQKGIIAKITAQQNTLRGRKPNKSKAKLKTATATKTASKQK